MEHSGDHCEPSVKVDSRLKVVGIVFGLFLLMSFLPGLEKLNENLFSYLKVMWWAVLLGLLIGGLIDYFFPEELIFKYLGRKKKRSLFYALGLGFLMSTCSHGILAISMQLHKKGASIASVITFLLASPWANLPVTILLFGFFGIKALWFIGVAMITALITGYIFMYLEKWGVIEKSKAVVEVEGRVRLNKFKGKESLKAIWRSTVHLSNMVLWWVLIGFILAAVLGAYVPHDVFMKYFGPTVGGMFMTLLLATVIEVCSEGSAPIAFEIFKQVGKLGNPFVFLMAGVVTDYTEIGLIWSNIGRKTAIWLPIVTVPQVMAWGFLFNYL